MSGEYTGVVKYYNSGKGYGFIIPDDGGEDVLLESSDIRTGTPGEGVKVIYQVESVDQGIRALEVRIL
jgi:CspA family cold shock protein